jgi:hypothetical protein
MCIRHVYATNVVKYFYSTVTVCCVTCCGSSLWVKNDPFRRSSVKKCNSPSASSEGMEGQSSSDTDWGRCTYSHYKRKLRTAVRRPGYRNSRSLRNCPKAYCLSAIFTQMKCQTFVGFHLKILLSKCWFSYVYSTPKSFCRHRLSQRRHILVLTTHSFFPPSLSGLFDS